MTLPEKLEKLKALEAQMTPGPYSLDAYYQCFIWGPQSQMIADDGMTEEGQITRMRGVGANLPLAKNGEGLCAARNALKPLIEVALAAERHLRIDSGGSLAYLQLKLTALGAALGGE